MIRSGERLSQDLTKERHQKPHLTLAKDRLNPPKKIGEMVCLTEI